MTTNLQQSTAPHPRWEAFKRSFKHSNYITDFWNWLMTLMSKAAELVLFVSVLYSGYQLLPGITHASAEVDAVVFVIQQAALDIGGMGLLKLAKRAELPKDSFPVQVGITLVVLMILNVVLASLKRAVPTIPPDVFVWVETVLLVARAIMAVLFGHAIHALREEYAESTITVKDASKLRQDIEELSMELSRVQHHFHDKLSSELSTLHESMQRQLSSQLSAVHESMQHLENSTVEEVRQVKASLEMQRQNQRAEREKRAERPVLRALPSIQQSRNGTQTMRVKEAREVTRQAAAAEKFDARAFVFACLQENHDLKLSEIERRAQASGQELSQPTI